MSHATRRTVIFLLADITYFFTIKLNSLLSGSLLSGICDLCRFWLSCLGPLVLLLPILSNLSMLSVPDEGYSSNVPDEGYSSNVPDEGYSRNVPDEGYSSNVPDEGYSSNVPDEGYSRNASCALNLISTFLSSKCKLYMR